MNYFTHIFKLSSYPQCRESSRRATQVSSFSSRKAFSTEYPATSSSSGSSLANRSTSPSSSSESLKPSMVVGNPPSSSLKWVYSKRCVNIFHAFKMFVKHLKVFTCISVKNYLLRWVEIHNKSYRIFTGKQLRLLTTTPSVLLRDIIIHFITLGRCGAISPFITDAKDAKSK